MKYDCVQIMTNAWRTYKYVGKKEGKTFSEVLKATWRLAKVSASIDKTIADGERRRAERARLSKIAKPAEKADYKGEISHFALYGHEFVSGGYCGD